MSEQTETKKLISELKVSELKIELEKLGLDKNGVKAVLIERLEKAFQSKEHSAGEEDKQLSNSSQESLTPNSNEETTEKNPVEESQVFTEVTENNESEDLKKNLSVDSQSADLENKSIVEEQPERSKHVEEAVSEKTTSEDKRSPKESERTNEANVGKNSKESSVQIATEITKANNEASPITATEKSKEVVTLTNDIIVINDDESTANKIDQIPTSVSKLVSISPSPISKSTNSTPSMNPLVIADTPTKNPVEEIEKTASVTSEKTSSKETPSALSNTKKVSPVEDKENDLAASVWVRGISNTTKAADLKALFSKHGKVQAAKIFTTKNKLSPTCFGYITMCDSNSADLAIQKLNRTNLKGKVITVEKANHSLLSQINRTTKAPTTSGSSSNNKDKVSTDNSNSQPTNISPASLPTSNEENVNKTSEAVTSSTNTNDDSSKKNVTKQLSKDSSPEIIILDKDTTKTSPIKTTTSPVSKKTDSVKKKIISTKPTSSQSDKKTVKLPTTNSSSSKREANTTRTSNSRGNGNSSTALRPTASHRSARAIVAGSKRRQFVTSSNRARAAIPLRSVGDRSRFERTAASKPSIRITKTSNGGIQVSTRRGNRSGRGQTAYSTRGYGYADSRRHSTSASKYPRSSTASHHSVGYSTEPIPTSEREEMLRIMRRREDEYRKKEEELRFQREKEKLRFERERLEREKLEVQQLKLTAQLANAQYAAFLNPTATQTPTNSASTANYSTLLNETLLSDTNASNNSNRLSSRDRANNKEATPKSSYKGNNSNYPKNSSHKSRSNSNISTNRGASSRRGENSSNNRGTRELDKHFSQRKRPFSRSPIRSSSSNRDGQFKTPFKTSKSSYEHHRTSAGSGGGYPQSSYSQSPLNRFGGGPNNSSDNLYDNFNNSTLTVGHSGRDTREKQHYSGGSNRGTGSSRSNRRSPFTSARRSSPRRSDGKNSSSRSRDAEFLIGGLSSSSRTSLGNDQAHSYASRTDPSYASRIANLAVGGSSVRNSTGLNSADEMFGAGGGYGRDSIGYGGLGSAGNRISNEAPAYRDSIGGYPLNNQWSAGGNRTYDLGGGNLGGSSSWATKNDGFGLGQPNSLGQGNNSYWRRDVENTGQNWETFDSVPASSTRYGGSGGGGGGGVGSYDNKHPSSYSRRY